MFDARRVAIALALLAVTALSLFYLAPGPIGRTSYVTTFGNSMEPRIHKGDLIVVRARSHYAVGDDVAYRSATLKQIVFHRIVAVEGTHYVMKGDHNTWLDQDKPTRHEILGREIFHSAGGGEVLQSSRHPAMFSLFALATVFTYKRVGSPRKRFEGRKSSPRLSFSKFEFLKVGEVGQANVWAIAGIGASCLVLLALSFTRPVNNETSHDVTLNHRGEFSYSAVVPGAEAVYLDGRVHTGDPIYSRLLDKVNVAFKYHLESEAKFEAQGTVELYVDIRDTSGWSRREMIQPSTPMVLVAGADSVAQGTFDIAQLASMTDKLEQMTGITRDSYSVVLKASVHINGETNGQVVQEAFEPELTFGLDALQLQLQASSGKTTDMLNPSGGGLLHVPAKHANAFFGVPVLFMRSFSVLGLTATALFAAPILLNLRRRTPRAELSESDRIARKYRKLLLPVSTFQGNLSGRVHETTSFDSLVRLAELHDQVIYNWERDGVSTYVVEEDGVVHRYVIGEPETLVKPARRRTAAAEKSVRVTRGRVRKSTDDS